MKKIFDMPQITGGGGERTLGFTLAEVLITLAIIGVVAALTIPSVIANTQQQEFKTGLKKAVSVLNSAITMNIALEGESPYDNANLFGYLQRHMSVMKSTTRIDFLSTHFIYTDFKGEKHPKNYDNYAFYTTDGMRYEFSTLGSNKSMYESSETKICVGSTTGEVTMWNSTLSGDARFCGGCGSLGLNNNPDNTQKPPCLILVDVNGDRKPTPQNVHCNDADCANKNKYWISDPKGKRIYDIFPIMITDKQAIPYGTAAQKAMYNTQK